MDLAIFFLATALIIHILPAWLALLISSRKIAEVSFVRAAITGVLILIANNPLFRMMRQLMPERPAAFLSGSLVAWIAFTIYHRLYRKSDLQPSKYEQFAPPLAAILFLVIQGGLWTLIKFGVSLLPG